MLTQCTDTEFNLGEGQAPAPTLMQLPGQWGKGAGMEDPDEVFQNN